LGSTPVTLSSLGHFAEGEWRANDGESATRGNKMQKVRERRRTTNRVRSRFG